MPTTPAPHLPRPEGDGPGRARLGPLASVLVVALGVVVGLGTVTAVTVA